MVPEDDAPTVDDDEGSSCCITLTPEEEDPYEYPPIVEFEGLVNEYDDDGWIPTPYPLITSCDEARVFSTRSIDASGI